MVKKHNTVYVKIIFGLGSKVSETCTACVFRRLYEGGAVCQFRTVSIPDDWVCVEVNNFSAFQIELVS